MKKDIPLDRVKELSFIGTKPFLTFRGSYDLFGDGSVVILPTPGHTPGSISVFARTKEEKFLFVGDAAYARKNYEVPINIGYRENRTASWDTLVRIHDLHKALPGVRIIPFHDPRFLKSSTDGPQSIISQAP